MSMTPFEVRLEVLKLAKDLVMEDYYTKRQQLESEFHQLCNLTRDTPITIPYPELPKVPSEEEIIIKAKTLNDFVSDTGKK